MIANASLLEIAAPGTPDSYGDVATPGAPTWTGRVPAYIRRKRQTKRRDNTSTSENTDELILQRTSGAPVTEIDGDQTNATTVLVEDRRFGNRITRRFRVIGVELLSAGLNVDSVRLTLDDERSA